jgi:hypothetical protein
MRRTRRDSVGKPPGIHALHCSAGRKIVAAHTLMCCMNLSVTKFPDPPQSLATPSIAGEIALVRARSNRFRNKMKEIVSSSEC